MSDNNELFTRAFNERTRIQSRIEDLEKELQSATDADRMSELHTLLTVHYPPKLRDLNEEIRALLAPEKKSLKDKILHVAGR